MTGAAAVADGAAAAEPTEKAHPAAAEPEETAGTKMPETSAPEEAPAAEGAADAQDLSAPGAESGEQSVLQEKLDAMTEQEKKLYGSFLHNQDTVNQIIVAIDALSMRSSSGNAIVTGKDNEATLNLARGLIMSARRAGTPFSGKTAKIRGDALSSHKMEEILKQVDNGALIITSAARIGRDAKASLIQMLQTERVKVIVILIDTAKNVREMLTRNEDIRRLFHVQVNAGSLNDEALVAFGREYARECEYAIDNLGILALHTRIEQLQTYDHKVSTEEVMAIVDEAIAHSRKHNIGHLMDVLLRKRYDDEDMVILREKDFLP